MKLTRKHLLELENYYSECLELNESCLSLSAWCDESTDEQQFEDRENINYYKRMLFAVRNKLTKVE